MVSKKNFDEDERAEHRKSKPKHSRNIPGQGMRVINKYIEEDDYDPFYDETEIGDEIFITHTKDTSQKQR
jgi:hypothetical protein